MRPGFKFSMEDVGELRRVGSFVGILALYLILNIVSYDARTGWGLADHPYPWKVTQVSKSQAFSLIREQKIKTYGMRRCQILMHGGEGKWYALDHFNTDDVVRELGQHAQYVAYYHRDLWY